MVVVDVQMKKKHICCGFAFGSSDLEFKSASDKIDIILG
jgi:hypothetical protein